MEKCLFELLFVDVNKKIAAKKSINNKGRFIIEWSSVIEFTYLMLLKKYFLD
jgi:hypothetical protein